MTEKAEAALHSELAKGGVTVYNDPTRAAFALGSVAAYHQFQRRARGNPATPGLH